MLRVGLTGGLASGKSTVAAMLRALGAELIEADELGRALMEPGQSTFSSIVAHFGPEVLAADGHLDRTRLAQIAFQDGRLQDLNGLVHPAVIAAQQRWMEELFTRSPHAIAVVESALIFEVERDARARGELSGILADWRERMDRVLVVTAPVELRIARFVARVAPLGIPAATAEADARRRLTYQISDEEKAAKADYVLDNTGDLTSLERQVTAVWHKLVADNN